MLIVLAGLPEPTVNYVVRDPVTGQWLRRFELAYRALRLAIEYEGRHHRDDDEVWAADIERREELDRETWRVVQVISKGLFDTPLQTLQRIEQARADRGATPRRTFADEWKRYFPGR
jgi:very-short-patch-repair endonuclease